MENKLGNQLRNLRTKRGISQEELALQAGVSLRTVQRFENAETTPRGDTVQRLFQIFGKSPEEVLDWSIEDNRGFLSTMALSGLTFIFSPFLGIFIPLILWLNRRGKVTGVEDLGKKMINFLILMAIPIYLLRAISWIKLLPSTNGDISLNGFHELFEIMIWVNAIAVSLAVTFCIWNAIALFRGKRTFWPISIPIIR
ncbi:helix-turn-helix domain-containing protein [Algoriphagus formosus]|uniref:helix-turn-helix domain-containing protein n=1 Tax=Algoriphagus formosus TaxID=2007308 RepID=UPI000C29173C|nr:helix-turn-helix domain-containing protein [Algoriphagus formosus]